MAFDQSVCELFVDECGVNYTPDQLLQMLIGKDANGCPVLKVAIPTNAPLSVGGLTEKIGVDVVTSATAYTADDNVGGILTLTDILRVSGGTAILEDIQLWALSNQKPNLLIDFWDLSPSVGAYVNDAAQIILGDHAKHIASVEVEINDWKDTGTISRASISTIGQTLKGNASRDIFMTIQDKTGVTFGSVAGLFVKVGVLQD